MALNKQEPLQQKLKTKLDYMFQIQVTLAIYISENAWITPHGRFPTEVDFLRYGASPTPPLLLLFQPLSRFSVAPGTMLQPPLRRYFGFESQTHLVYKAIQAKIVPLFEKELDTSVNDLWWVVILRILLFFF